MITGTLIIPALNEAANIAQQLRQVRELVGDQWQLVLVDGGSTDDTVAQAHPFCDHIISSAPGRARQMNAGAAQADGHILLFLHADTRLPRDFIAQIQQFAQQGGQWGRFDVRLDGGHPLFRLIEWMMNHRSRWTGIATGDQAIFMTRDFFQRCGGFGDLPLMEDIDFCKRARRLARPFCISSRVTTSARKWQKNGILRTILLMWWLRLAFFVGVPPAVLHRWYYPSPCPR